MLLSRLCERSGHCIVLIMPILEQLRSRYKAVTVSITTIPGNREPGTTLEMTTTRPNHLPGRKLESSHRLGQFEPGVNVDVCGLVTLFTSRFKMDASVDFAGCNYQSGVPLIRGRSSLSSCCHGRYSALRLGFKTQRYSAFNCCCR